MSEIQLPDSLPDWIKKHVEVYLQDGNAGHYWDARQGGADGLLTTLLLTTTGRKSGKRLILPLIYRPTGDGGYCVIASKGGAPAHPSWFVNLQAKPEVELQVATDRFDAKARVATGAERDRLWQMMVDYYPPYTDYQAATSREIPVVVLEPV